MHWAEPFVGSTLGPSEEEQAIRTRLGKVQLFMMTRGLRNHTQIGGSLIVVVLLSLFVCAFQVNDPLIPWQKALSYRTTEIYPIEIGKFGYPYVAVSINGQKFKLAWDTANMSGLVLNSDLAARL